MTKIIEPIDSAATRGAMREALEARRSMMFKCNCPFEVRSGCSEPKCPHYAPPHPSPAGQR